MYLAIQTQQNTDTINSQSRQNLLDSAQFEQSVWVQYPQVSVLIIDNSTEMTLEEKVQLDSLLILALTRPEFALSQYQAGVLDENIWIAETSIISLIPSAERTRAWWNLIGQYALDQTSLMRYKPSSKISHHMTIGGHCQTGEKPISV
jgi:hypothetical protein|tara:strand:+ start:328 stop:771 length:444 start_codon:yes stop_codon:yes gene_type:complete